MMRHPEYGAEILKKAPSLHIYIPAVLHHHEWYNGRGYPCGIGGDEIPLHAMIISISDAFDAMTSARPYRKALTREEAFKELRDWSGKQFHPQLVKIFIDAMKDYSIFK